MNADFINQMVALRDLAAPLAEGVPKIRSLILQKRGKPPGRTSIVTTFLEIKPLPHITTPTPKVIKAFESLGISIEADDYQVQGVSRKYTREDLIGTGITYWVDGVLSDDERTIIDGQECDFVGNTSDTLCWSLILRRKPDDR